MSPCEGLQKSMFMQAGLYLKSLPNKLPLNIRNNILLSYWKDITLPATKT